MGMFGFGKKKNEKLNPLRGLMNLNCYSVSGTNPATNRKKSVVSHAVSEDEAVSQSGLVDCTVAETGWGIPTQTQLDFIKRSGAELPTGATARDATALIERLSHNESKPIPSKLVAEAAAKGVAMSFLTGQHQYERYIEDWESGARGSNGR